MGNARLAEEIVDIVIDELWDRGGFDDWWCDIDEETQLEISDALIDAITEKLDQEGRN